jgi:carbonic anhydrase/acetyltransferase-like protein (isoleucine patch superfamily)
MSIYALGELLPRIHPRAFVHPDAIVIGDVSIGPDASIWPSAVLRGDYGPIKVHEGSSVQDGTVVHAGPEYPTVIGPWAVVGHNAHLEGCTVAPWALVASQSTVLHYCVVHSHATVGAGAVVTNRMQVPSFAMALGVPARIHPDRVTEFEHRFSVNSYIELAARTRDELRLVG